MSITYAVEKTVNALIIHSATEIHRRNRRNRRTEEEETSSLYALLQKFRTPFHSDPGTSVKMIISKCGKYFKVGEKLFQSGQLLQLGA